MHIRPRCANRFSTLSASLKSSLKIVSRFFLLFLLLCFCFVIFLTGSAMLRPNTAFYRNLFETTALLATEGVYHKVGGITLDNYSDAFMINIVYSMDPQAPFNAIMENKRAQTKEILSPPEMLEKIVKSEFAPENLGYQKYFRYWHGGTALWRTFLFFGNY